MVTSPHDIARRTLRLLATRKIPPTPESYREIYTEVAGTALQDAAPAYSSTGWRLLLRDLARLLCDQRRPDSERMAALDRALAAGGDLEALYLRLRALVRSWTGASGAAPAAEPAEPDLQEALVKVLRLMV